MRLKAFKNKKIKYIAGVLFVATILLSYSLYKDISAYRLEKDIASINERLVFEAIKSNNYKVVSLLGVSKKIDEYFIVDVREKEEFEQGRIKGAINLRLGDILNSKSSQEEIINNAGGKKILFFCHNGERSKIAANFLGRKNEAAFNVIEHAFDELRSDNDLKDAIWQGTSRRVLPAGFWEELKNRGYKIKEVSEISTKLVIDITTQGISVYENLEDKKIILAPMVRMPSNEVNKLIKSIGQTPFSVLCDSKLSCFYAKVLAYRIEKNGGKFKGYYLWKHS